MNSTQEKNGKHVSAMMLNSSHIGDLINQNLLDSGATKYTNNCRNAFTNFWPLKKVAYIATKKAIMFYGQGDMVKMMIYGEVIFQKVLYILTFVNNL